MPDFYAMSASAATASAVEPARAPAPEPTTLPVRPEGPRDRRWLIAIAVLALLAVAATATYSLRRRQASATTSAAGLRTAVAARRTLVQSVRVNGTVEATQSYVVAAPSLTGGGFSTLVITKLIPAGTHVKKGDLLVEFDPQNQLSNARDRRADFRDLEEQIAKKQADQAAQRAKDDTELKQAEDAEKSAALEIQRNEVVSRIDAEKNQETLEEARAKYAQLKQTYELKRRAARSELRILEIQRDRARNAMLHAESNAQKMTITSPSEGIVVLNTVWKGSNMGEVQEGDEVRTGVPFLQVMNPNFMQVRAKVNQADVRLLRPGMAVEIHLDAYPELTLAGRVERIAAIGSTSYFSPKVRTFVALFSIQGTAPQLMPDLSAAVDVRLEAAPNAVVIPRDAIVRDKDATFAWMKSGQGFTRKPVRVGAMNDVEAAIESGVSAGDVVLRSPDPQKGAAR